ncbi:MAG: tetraacyldisaccharide 4'-kinase [Mariprofundales bacterium]
MWLKPFSCVYQWFNRRNLQRRAARAVISPLPWISVGNITVGGSGKSPFVAWLSDQLRHGGWRPVIVCRGDGGNSKQPQLVESDADPAIVGDEACMLARITGVAVIAGADRVKGAQMAAHFGNIMILDDGFQYRQLARQPGRSCDVVLLPRVGLGNGALLPAGPLREPLVALDRADLLVASGDDGAWLPSGDSRVWHWSNPVSAVEDVMTSSVDVPTEVALIAGIARPQRVIASLQKLGITVVAHHFFADHHRYRNSDLTRLLSQHFPIVTTGKDAVKLRRLWPEHRPLWVCQHQPQGEDGLLATIVAHLPDDGAPHDIAPPTN